MQRRYKAITILPLLTYFPQGIEVDVTVVSKRGEILVKGVVEGKEVSEVFSYLFKDNLKPLEDVKEEDDNN